MRLFIATSLTPAIHHEIDSLLQDLISSVGTRVVKWVKPSGIHLTLKFLGDTPAEQIHRVQKRMDEVTGRFAPFPISIEEFGCFPSFNRPRVLWVGVSEKTGALQAINEQIEIAMVDLGFPTEGRAFHPHLTLGRVRKGARNSDRRNLANRLNEIPKIVLGNQEFNEISLIKSDLQPTGAVYTKLYSSVLGGGE